jgi:hypothetical protein
MTARLSSLENVAVVVLRARARRGRASRVESVREASGMRVHVSVVDEGEDRCVGHESSVEVRSCQQRVSARKSPPTRIWGEGEGGD